MKKAPQFYYQNNTRSMFFVAAILIPVSFLASIAIAAVPLDSLASNMGIAYPAILFVALFMSLLFGIKKGTRAFNILIALFGAVYSGITAAILYFQGPNVPVDIFFFWINQILLIVFLFASYFSIQAIKK